jgi:hypothetical protein
LRMQSDRMDEALRRQPTWDPPPHFGRRVAALAQLRAESTRMRASDVPLLVVYAVRGLLLDTAARFSGLRWSLHQRWRLLAGN